MTEPKHWIDLIREFLTWGDVNPIKFFLIFWLAMFGIIKGIIGGGDCRCKNCRNA